MQYEDFLDEELKLHRSTDKVYRAHMNKMEVLTKRQVEAQEAMVQKLGEVIDLQLKDPEAKNG